MKPHKNGQKVAPRPDSVHERVTAVKRVLNGIDQGQNKHLKSPQCDRIRKLESSKGF